MLIKNLYLKNFRNYEEQEFIFDDGLNILSGRNAQGKTNCVEAVFYLCTGTSMRAKRDKQLILHGQEQALIRASAQTNYGSVTLEAHIFDNKRELFVNGVKLNKATELLGNVNAVFFSPQELRIIQDGPDERRRMINVAISQMSKNYYTALLRYNKILEQRNALLKNRDESLVLSTLPIWDAQLCKYASIIVRHRRDYVKKLSPLAESAHAFLTDNAEKLYVGNEKSYEGDEKQIEERLIKEFEKNYERDMRLGFTSIGPHREDLDVILNGKDAKAFASQGQTRTVALAIKLAEVEIFREFSNEYPILILDDVLSELDLPRRKKLVERVKGIQTILTCTHAERILAGKQAKKIKIADGKVVE